MAPHLEALGFQPVFFRLSNETSLRDKERLAEAMRAVVKPGFILLDGGEQLSTPALAAGPRGGQHRCGAGGDGPPREPLADPDRVRHELRLCCRNSCRSSPASRSCRTTRRPCCCGIAGAFAKPCAISSNGGTSRRERSPRPEPEPPSGVKREARLASRGRARRIRRLP